MKRTSYSVLAPTILVGSYFLFNGLMEAAAASNEGKNPENRFLNSVVSARGYGTVEKFLVGGYSPVALFRAPGMIAGFELKRYGPGETPKKIALSAENMARREILDLLVAKDPDYVWESYNGAVNVFPRGSNEDKYSGSALNAIVAVFSVKNVTYWEAVAQLAAIARPLGTELLVGEGEDRTAPYLPKMEIHLANATVRECLNEIARGDVVSQWEVLPETGGLRVSMRLTQSAKEEFRRLIKIDYERKKEKEIESMIKKGYRLENDGWRKPRDGKK